ncbi:MULTISPECIES: H-NS family nucleoid-associated regulatory protein [Cupriavidus]|uniref:DNA-binding protein H-NS-like C-terminal domain-containing protein n=1 Tax=Cupriavidus metallidurans TaxID=119219 RepID=A0A482J6I9_9BURK|nr:MULTISPECIES: H-NS family nucleoid-associated regulatory protein [Cupriavidus]MWL91913.1 H-NS histone family protein [Cupriavidus sp. SW-Y-13]QBP14574.1 hypothetical protein DDF84_033310 [Cupriavidus metallidurans]
MPSAQISFALPSEGAAIRARDEAILWVKSAIARHGITLQQLELAGCFDSVKTKAMPKRYAKYIDAAGHIWDGVGAIPEWLQRAINAGQSMEHFRVT